MEKPSKLMKSLMLICCMVFSIYVTAQDKDDAVQKDSAKVEKKATKELPLEPTRKIKLKTDEGTWMS